MRRRISSATGQETKVRQLTRELNEALERQTATSEVLQIISRSAFDLDSVLRTLVETAAKLCRADPAQIYRREGEVYRSAAIYGKITKAYRAIEESGVISPGLGTLIGRVVLTARPVQIVDAWDDPEYKAKEDARTGNVRSMLGVPLIRDGELIGAFALARGHVEPFSPREIDLVRTFADQAVIAIENARLFNETKEALERQTATSELLKVIGQSTFDLKPVFETLAESTVRLCNAERAFIFRFDGQLLRVVATHNVQPEFRGWVERNPIAPGRNSSTARTALERRTIHIHDVMVDPEYTYGAKQVDPIRTVLTVPILRAGELLGVLLTYRHEVQPFTDKQIALVETFADQAAIAIQNTRLFNETKESLERQTATSGILEIISSSPGELAPVFDAMLNQATRLCGAQFSSLALREEQSFRHVAFRDIPPAFEAWLQANNPTPILPGGGIERMVLTKQVVQVTDLKNMKLYIDRQPQTVALGELGGAQTMLWVPMIKDEAVVGMVTIFRKEVEPFTDQQIELVRDFARQAVIAIENTRLFNETKEALEQQSASADILSVISNSVADAKPVFGKILESCKHLFGGDELDVLLVDEHGQLNIAAYMGDSHDVVAASFPTPVERTPAGRAIRERRVMHWPDLVDGEDVPGVLRKMAKLIGYRSMAFAPMLWEDRGIGAIGVARSTGPFKPKELSMLQTFADQAVIAIQNARLFNETNEALERQTATADILKVIARSPDDVQPVLDVIVATSNRLCNALSSVIFLLRDGKFHVAAESGTMPEYIALLRANPIALGQRGSVLARAARERRTVHVPNAADDPEFRDGGPLGAGGPRALLSVPLMHDGQAIGGITMRQSHLTPFTVRQIEAVATFADQAVIAIQNARLFNETKEALERQTATADILKVIASSPSDVQPVFEAIVNSAAKLFEPWSATITTLKDGQLHWNATAALNPNFKHEGVKAVYPIPFDPVRAPSARAMLERRIIEIPDTAAPDTPEFTRKATAAGCIRSITFVPLVHQDNGIGTIILSHPQAGFRLSEKQLALVQTFADQAVIAIENTRLFNEVQARTDDLSESLQQQTATADVLKVISRSAFDLQPVLDTLIASAVVLCGAVNGTICLREGNGYRHGASSGIEGDWAKFLEEHPPTPGRSSLTGRVILSGRVESVPDVLEDPDYVIPLLAMNKTRSVLGVPLLRDDRVEGVLLLARTEPGLFTQRQIELVQTFADQAVIAIENVRLFEEVQARTTELTESLEQQTATADVLKVISRSTFDLQTVLQTLVESAARLCDADKATITRQKDGVFFRAETCGFSDEFIDYARTVPVVPDRGSASGRALLEGAVVHIHDVQADPNYTFMEGMRLVDFRTALAVPMLREGVPVGVVVLTRPEVRPFTDKQIESATTFADQAAIAIENVRLFESVEARTRELAASLEDLGAAQDRLIQTEKLASLGQLTAGIAHEIKNPLNFVNNFSALSAELVDEVNDVLKGTALGRKPREELEELTQMLKSNLEKVVQHGKRADSIVKNMLLHSREGSGEHRSTDINSLVEESLNLAYHGARAEKPGFNVILERDLDPDAGTAELYPQEITRALLNLISNGFYAATKRKSEAGETFEASLSATTKNLGNSVEIRIRDNGAGIPPEVKEKMFNPFFTTKPAGEGTGLGLSMSHDIIVKQHGGKIDVGTEPGAFTEFIITLPRNVTAPERKPG